MTPIVSNDGVRDFARDKYLNVALSMKQTTKVSK